jgi:hypothetical protein
MVFLECSAKTKKNIEQVFHELVLKVSGAMARVIRSLTADRIERSSWRGRSCGRKAMVRRRRPPALRSALRLAAIPSRHALANNLNRLSARHTSSCFVMHCRTPIFCVSYNCNKNCQKKIKVSSSIVSYVCFLTTFYYYYYYITSGTKRVASGTTVIDNRIAAADDE